MIIFLGCKTDRSGELPSWEEYKLDYESSRYKWGLIDRDGNVIIEPIYDDIHDPLSRSFIGANKDGKWGFISRNGDNTIPFQFKAIQPFSEGLAFCQKFSNDWVLIDSLGKEISTDSFDHTSPFSENMAVCSKDGLYGYLSAQGKWVIAPKYIGAQIFKDSFAVVKRIEEYSIINKKGVLVFSEQAKLIKDVGKFFIVKKDDKKLIIVNKRDLQQRSPVFEDISFPNQDQFAVKKNGAWKLYNFRTKTAIDTPCSRIRDAGEGAWLCRQKGGWRIMDAAGAFAKPNLFPIVHRYNDGWVVVQKEENAWNYVNHQGEELLPVDLPVAFDFKDGMARITTYEGIFFIDTLGKISPLGGFLEIKDFHNGLARFQQE